MLEIETSFGLARAEVRVSAESRGALVLGHGAGGGIGAPDLVAVARAAESEQISVVLVEQPYRVAGRRSPAPARQLDGAWVAVVAQLQSDALAGLPLVVGGRSSGARVACRTAVATGAVGVLCLAFPLQPPRRFLMFDVPGRKPTFLPPFLRKNNLQASAVADLGDALTQPSQRTANLTGRARVHCVRSCTPEV